MICEFPIPPQGRLDDRRPLREPTAVELTHEQALALVAVLEGSGQNGERAIVDAQVLPVIRQHLADVERHLIEIREQAERVTA